MTSRTGDCSLLMELLREKPKPITLDFSDLNKQKMSNNKRKLHTTYSGSQKKFKLKLETVIKLEPIYEATNDSLKCSVFSDITKQINNSNNQSRPNIWNNSSELEYDEMTYCFENVYVVQPPAEFDNIHEFYFSDKLLLE